MQQKIASTVTVLLTLLALTFSALGVTPVHAAGNVGSCNESSLRTAISGGGTVTFSCSGTIVLASTIDIYGNVILDGAGQNVTISGNNAVRVFLVQSGYSLTLKNITVTNGYVGAGYPGGAIQTFGTLNIENSTISNSRADLGAGIYANDGSTVTVTNSTISGNQANSGANATGGGILNGGILTVTNSVFSNNGATNEGGAIASVTSANISGTSFLNNSAGRGSGGIYANGPLTVTNSIFTGNSAGTSGGAGLTVYYTTGTISNSTFTGNVSGGDGGGIRVAGAGTVATITNTTFSGNTAAYYGGGLYNTYGAATITNSTFAGNGSNYNMFSGNLGDYSGTTTLKNTIIANSANGANCSGTIVDGGGNLVWGDTSCPGINANPLFGTLGNYGGSAMTMPLLPGSPAINATSANCPATDQRGIARGATCDSGAFESQGFTLAKTGGDNQSALAGAAFANPLTVSVTSAHGEPVNGGMLTFTAPASGASTNPAVNTATIVSGSVSKSVTANGTIGGPYNVTAGAASVNFSLTNSCSSSPTLVTNNADSGPCSLREVIANAPSGSAITFDNDYTITLASQLEIIDKTITITGVGHHITISGNNAVRVFHVGSVGGSGNLTIDHLNIVNGKSTVNECAGSAVSCGGGLMLEYLTTATVLNSTFANNDGGSAGGAIYSYYGNPLTVTNSTFINNHAQAYAGAIGIFYGSATLTNNTFTGNSTSLGYGSTLLNTWGTLTLKNNIIVKGATSVNACDNDFSDGGSTNDGGGNIRFGDATCVGTTVNPLLGPLDDYGGNVPTIPLLPGSAAINAASANCPAADQRGIARGATCDSGAFESQGFTLAISGGNNQTTTPNAAFPIPLTVSVSSAHGEPVNGGQVAFTPPSSGAGAVLTGNPATVAIGAASVTATANGTLGAYNVTASAAGAASVDFSLTNIAMPVITWVNPANIVYGTPLSGTQLNATANTPGVFTYTPASGAILNAGTHTLHVDFIPTDAVNYTNASKDVSITVAQATSVLTWSNPASISYGTPLGATQLNATANTTGAFIYTPAAGAALDVGTHTLHVDFIPTDAVNYTNASKDVSITVLESTAPLVVSITRVDPSPTELDSLHFTVTFSESVTGVDEGDFILTTTGMIDGESIINVDGSGDTYTVTVSRGTGGGTLRLDVPASATITDQVGNPLTTPYESGEAYTILFKFYFPLVGKS